MTRFDGLRFEHVDLQSVGKSSSTSLYTLYAPDSGGLWLGFTFGGAGFLKDGHLTMYAESDGLPPGSVKGFAKDSEGAVWAATTSGLARLEGSRWRTVATESGYSGSQTEALLMDSAGTLWVAASTEVFFLPRGKSAFQKSDLALDPLITGVGLAESRGGTVWVVRNEVAYQLAQNAPASVSAPTSTQRLLADRDGNLWVLLTGPRLVRVPHKGLQTRRLDFVSEPRDVYGDEDGLAATYQGYLLEDREGNVWVASTNGLERFSERNVSPVQASPRKKKGKVDPFSASLVAGEDGAVLVTDMNLGVFELQGERLRQHQRMEAVTSAIRAADGTTWFGSKNGVCRDSSGHLECKALPAGGGDHDVQAMAQDRSGALWVSIVRNGVFRLADGKWTAYGDVATLPKLTAVTLATDAKGRIWFGYTEGRVAVLDGTHVAVFDGAKRLPVGNVTALYGLRGRVWAGGDFGLAEFDGAAFRLLAPEPGTSFDGVTGIVEVASGDLWINSARGVVHIAALEVPQDRDRSRHVRAETFEQGDGVMGASTRLRPLPTAIEGSDGRLWFARSRAMYVIDPNRLHRNPVPPPVLIRSVSVGDKAYPAADNLKLPEGTNSLSIEYVGINFTAPEKVRFRYRLDDDAAWQDVHDRRQAFFTGLRPGRHRFQVIAANNDGVWNETGATLDFEIPPTFVQTVWFVVLCVSGAVMFAWLAAWLRERQVAARLRGRFAERMAERERIARELHDTLLQSTQGLVLRFQAVANRMAPDDPTRSLLNEALARADSVMVEGRDRVLDLRVSADPIGELPEAFAAAGEELAKRGPINFRAVVEGSTRDLQPVAKDEIFRIGREALLNAFRHANAETIEIQIIYGDDALRLRIRDDGIGVDSSVLERGSRPDHWGLQGMRERAKRIGARLDVWSRPGAGTEVELRVPVAAAYAVRIHRLRWRPFRSSARGEI